jgi:hypothetical protein
MNTATAPLPKGCRKRKTRTKAVSNLPALHLSSLLMSEIELIPGKEHMVCPACRTWCPITGLVGTPKLVPHHTEPVDSDVIDRKRCRNSNRVIVLDISLETWRRRRAEGTAETSSRRSTRVLRKPKVPAATPIHRIQKQSPKLIEAASHRKTCLACTETTWCAKGKKLADVAREAERRDAAVEQMRTRRIREQHPAEWAKYLPAVEATNTRRRAVPEGNTIVMPLQSTTLPVGTPTTATNIDRKRAKKQS